MRSRSSRVGFSRAGPPGLRACASTSVAMLWILPRKPRPSHQRDGESRRAAGRRRRGSAGSAAGLAIPWPAEAGERRLGDRKIKGLTEPSFQGNEELRNPREWANSILREENTADRKFLATFSDLVSTRLRCGDRHWNPSDGHYAHSPS